MSQYYTTIGLEIHAELATASKMFCSCPNVPDAQEANQYVCPVCLAHPGTLPVPNKQAIESVIRVGLALGGTIAWDFTEFDRKNYFYPDIPKGYQISQYKYPIVSGGELAGVKITRIHLEEDTATSSHGSTGTLVDYNRAGVPLMELVTEPVIHTSKDAGDFGRELQLVLKYLGVSEANMEKGQMRVELNISISSDPAVFGTKVEVKNLNSFRVVERAAEYEIARMRQCLEDGTPIVQETRGWDDASQATFSQRKKENSQEYRYFPDPDIPKYILRDLFDEEVLRAGLPELPAVKRKRFADLYGIKAEDIESFIVDVALSTWYESLVAVYTPGSQEMRIATNYTTSDIQGLRKQDAEANLPPVAEFRTLVSMIVGGELSSRGAKDILSELVHQVFDPREYAIAHDLIQKNDVDAIALFAQSAIDAHPTVVAEYKAGKETSIQFLVGQVMKASKGSANPALALEALKKLLA